MTDGATLWPVLMVGAAVLLLAAGGVVLLFEARDEELAHRVRSLAAGGRPERRLRLSFGLVLLSLLRRLGDRLRNTALMSPKDVAEFEHLLTSAGLNARSAVGVLIGTKMVLPPIAALLTYAIAEADGWSSLHTVMGAGIALPVGMFLPNWAMGFMQRRYRLALERGIPDALDLIVICAEAGLGLETAIERVAAEMRGSNPAVAFEFSLLDQELRMLSDRRRALANFGDRAAVDALKRLAATIMQTLQYGTPLSRSLRALAAELRQERLTRMEEKASKLPALLVVPMILFILPCLFIVILGPAIINVSKALGGSS